MQTGSHSAARRLAAGVALCAAAWIVAATTGCAAGPTAADPDVLAVFHGGSVTRAELDAHARPPAPPDPGAAEPTAPAADWRVEALTEIAVTKALAAEAPADDPLLVHTRDEAVGVILREAMAHELGWDRLTVSEEEARKQYDEHPEQYRTPEKLRLQNLFLRAEVKGMPAAERDKVRQRMEEIRAEILAGAEFSAMAQRYSQSATAESGGYMPLSADADVFPAFAQEVWGLKDGEVSEVIDTPTGFQLAKVLGRLPGRSQSFDEVAVFARKRALTAKVNAAQAEFVREAGRRHGLITRYERLDDPWVRDDEALVEIGDYRLTFADLRDRLPDTYAAQLYNHRLAHVYEFLDQAARNRLLELEARRTGVADRDEVQRRIAAAEETVRAQFALETRLKAQAAKVPEPELREYFHQNEQRYQTVRSMDLSVIFLTQDPDEPLWLTLKRGEAVVRRLRGGEDFAALAKEVSRHYSAPNGGKILGVTDSFLGRQVQSRTRFRKVLARLEEGEVSDALIAECYEPDKLQYFPTGVIIVRLDKVHPPAAQPFEAVVDLVRESYLRRNFQRLANEARSEVAAAIDLHVLTDRLPPL